ncbi:MAG: hypothetical protein LBI12_04220 [Treponema sp.]|jgi:hypothetical protein|nr:hypothetical protein [Treponema sp.]
MKKTEAFVFLFSLSLLFSAALWPQDFSSINSDLGLLENLINDTLENMQEQQKLLEDLKKNLDDSGNLIAGYENITKEQENLLADLQIHLDEMSEIYRMQSALSAKYERSSRFWRTFTLIAIPATAVISGVVVWIIVN